MIIPLCQKTPADLILGTQWSMWVCLLTWDCLSHYNFHMAYKKMFNLVRWGVELKMNWLNWSIPISSGFQFQFNSNSKSFNSIPIQFMLNWIELIINSNSIHELIRALHFCIFFRLHRFDFWKAARLSDVQWGTVLQSLFDQPLITPLCISIRGVFAGNWRYWQIFPCVSISNYVILKAWVKKKWKKGYTIL